MPLGDATDWCRGRAGKRSFQTGSHPMRWTSVGFRSTEQTKFGCLVQCHDRKKSISVTEEIFFVIKLCVLYQRQPIDCSV